MAQTKSRVSISILSSIVKLLDQLSIKTGKNKSQLVEEALQRFLEDRLDTDTKYLGSLTFDDLPNEDTWLQLQNDI